jgi:bacillithiol biosynthesis cysteine-adding enzyme BshC
MTVRPPTIVEYGAFQQPPSPLFRDYLLGSDRVAPFYDGGRWDLDALARAADASLALPRRRDELADALVRQQEGRGAAQASRRARELADGRATALVTGQQAGLFGGPLYVLYKALGAIKVAARLQEKRGAPVVPVFWVASDDHDFAEVRSTSVLDDAGQIRTLRYTPEREPVGLPASRVILDQTITPLIAELGRALPAGMHRDGILEMLRGCYRPGVSLSDAFARLLSALMPDLVVLDASDPALKRLVVPVMSREVAEASPTSRLAREIGQQLLAAGYHQQVPVRSGFLNLFVFVEEERRALGAVNGSIEVRGLGKRIPVADAVRMMEADPSPWSPGVLLRPLAQDLMLPSAAYVGGPAEIAYHAQIGPSYRHFKIPRPVVLPRPSVTLVEPAQARALDVEGLTLPDLQQDPEILLARWTRDAHPQVEEAFTRTREALEREMAVVEQRLGDLDPTLRAATDGARGRALHQIQTLHEKATRALKKRDQTRADRLRRTRDALLPGGSFQERGLGLISLVARQGPAVVGDLLERIDPWARGHQVIHL